MFRKVSAFFTAALFVTLSFAMTGNAKATKKESASVRVPLNLAILIQDDLTSRVGNEIGVTRDFIRSLPDGSRVMVAYITSGSLQVRQPFTTDVNRAANS
jgi:invasion protein IalB